MLTPKQVMRLGARLGPFGLAWWIQSEEKKNGWLVAGLIRGCSSGNLKNRMRTVDLLSLVNVIMIPIGLSTSSLCLPNLDREKRNKQRRIYSPVSMHPHPTCRRRVFGNERAW